jgi:hypothetical protein
MVFKPGKDWNGNSKGAPKKQFRRDDFTDDLFLESKDRVRIVNDILFDFAIIEKEPWAIKEVLRIYTTVAKNRTDIEHNVANSMLSSTISHIPKEVLEAMRANVVEELSKYRIIENV